MKKYLPGFLAGVCTTILLGSFGLTALAASGAMTITVDPIDIQVNGETFVPTDVNGVEVPVFAYNGTTYAPLRALAEAYGLEVGYDVESNMATVTDPDAPVQPPATDTFTTADYSNWTEEDKAAYQEFKDMWDVKYSSNGEAKYYMDGTNDGTPWESYTLINTSGLSYGEVCNVAETANTKGYISRLVYELRSNNVRTEIYFCPENGPIAFGIIVE